MKPQKMIEISHPQLLEDIKATQTALDSNQKWLNDHILTEDEKDAGRLIVESNKEARLKASLADLNSQLETTLKNASVYWNSHNTAGHRATGIKAVKATIKSISKLKDTLQLKAAFKAELERNLKEREADITMFKARQKQYPAFINTLDPIVES